jgi:UDP-N-acetylmuramyl pentapeptide phosphotransferase/UDP-N-acetylglucosamine-1-phosphate transferase
MFEIILIIFFPLFINFLNSFFIKKKLFPNFSGSIHQSFFNNKEVPLSGGIFLCIIILYIFKNEPFILIFSVFLIFLIGFFSDINYLSSVYWRFFLQSIILFSFIFLTETNIESIRINFLDYYLNNFWISCFFTTFCLIIVLNGTNFIDGLNGLIISYSLIIIFILFRLNLINLFFSDIDLLLIIVSLFSLLALNFHNKLFMGDSGSYLLGFLIGYFLIMIYKMNSSISPFFIALLLWYPAFETLFSIIRKLKTSKSPVKPDNNHFHHLLFFFIEKKLKFKKLKSNNISSIIIILYNFFIFNISALNIYFTYYQIFLIIINIMIYLIIYMKLSDFKKLTA